MNDFQNSFKNFLADFEPYYSRYFLKRIKEVAGYPHLIKEFYVNLEDFGRGGKAIRPFLVYLGYTACGGKDLKKILPICLAFELIHDGFLIEDDIIDESETRRGKSTIHKRSEKKFGYHYGVSQAIMLADIASFEAFGLVNAAQFDDKVRAKCSKKLINVLLETVYGEILDVEYTYVVVKLSQIWQMTSFKTAKYTFVGPLTLGGICAEASNSRLNDLEEFGLLVGTAFQLQDDILGVFGNEGILGKSVLSDMREGKNTILIYKTRELADSKQQVVIGKLWGKKDGDMGDIREMREIIGACGALEWCRKKNRQLIGQAKSAVLEITDDRQLQSIFNQLAEYVTTRQS